MTVADHDTTDGDTTDGADADRLRADVYRLLAQTLAAPPSPVLLALLGDLRGDATPLGTAFDDLAAAARDCDPKRAEREHNALFIGVVQGELVPYASYYRTGFLSDRPLAAFRADLHAIGFERAPGVAEPEDHIASLCETMAALILDRASLAVQRHIFARHLAPWAGNFFGDLERAASAVLYRPVGTIGRLFLSIEKDAFAMLEAPAPQEADA